VNAIVLAAGLGTRMRPLSGHVPKPLLPVAGRPLLGRIIGSLAGAGCARVVVNTHHLAGRVESFLRGIPEAGLVAVSHEPAILGSGGALVRARKTLAAEEFFLYHNADELTDLDVRRAVDAHLAAGSPLATLALHDAALASRVLVSKGDEVLGFASGRSASRPAGSRLLAFIGVAVISREIFGLLPKEERFCSVMDALLRGMIERPGCVRAFVPGDIFWRNIEDIGGYLNVHREVLVDGALAGVPAGPVQVCAGAEVDPGAELAGFVSVCRGARIEAGAKLTDCVVLGGARVGAGAAHRSAVVGDGFAIAAAPA